MLLYNLKYISEPDVHWDCMLYDENLLKKASELLKEIEEFRAKKLDEVRSIIKELNGDGADYSYDGQIIHLNDMLTYDQAKNIIANMSSKNKREVNSKEQKQFRDNYQKRNKYSPDNPYPPKDLR